MIYDLPAVSLLKQLIVSGLGCVRGGRRIFTDVDFTLRSGEAIAVCGDNGAGKTSLLRIIGGLLPSVAGRVNWQMMTTETDTAVRRLPCHFMGEQDGFKAGLTLDENLRFSAGLMRVATSPSRLAAVRDGVGLTAGDANLATLSAGQRRRAVLARLLLVSRPLWLLDEPTITLDASGQAILSDMVDAHLTAGGMALVATHTPLAFCTKTVMLAPPTPSYSTMQ